jgi:hypothetical protein
MTRDLIDLRDPKEEGTKEVGISLHAIIRNPNPKTMRVEVKPNGCNFMALIDKGVHIISCIQECLKGLG